jgi:hypothetical protein
MLQNDYSTKVLYQELTKTLFNIKKFKGLPKQTRQFFNSISLPIKEHERFPKYSIKLLPSLIKL